jgi:hypothetical protein
MRKILLPISLLVLLAIDLMAFDAIRSSNEGLIFFGWFAIFFSAVLYAIMALQFLSKND